MRDNHDERFCPSGKHNFKHVPNHMVSVLIFQFYVKNNKTLLGNIKEDLK